MNTIHERTLLLRTVAEAGVSKLSQRTLAKRVDVSLGKINALVNEAIEEGLLEAYAGRYVLTKAGWSYLEPYKVDNAIILSAGIGSRFVPFTYDNPKGLLKVHGQPMIERQIEQLHEAGITDITIVIGYLKEKFDYLIDKYGVKLVFNPEFAIKNNFVSLYCVLDKLKNTYLLASDHWLKDSIFHSWEPFNWLSCTYFEGATKEWGVSVGAYGRITDIDVIVEDTWALNGPAYFTKSFSRQFSELVEKTYKTPGTDDYFWESILMENLKDLEIYINKQSAEAVYEFETLDEIRRFDESYTLETDNVILKKISEIFGVAQSEITGIEPLKLGMTNQSFVFRIGDAAYVFRLPGKGTEYLLSRKSEKRSYELVKQLDLTDELVYFDDDTGVKISKFYEGARVVDAENDAELRRAMRLLSKIHGAGIEAEYSFNVEEMIDFYEKLAEDIDAILFTDYSEVREKANELFSLRKKLAIPEILCHIDYVNANILVLPNDEMRVIDWEYSGAADPITDIAMFSIYSSLTRERADLALTYYLDRKPDRQETARLYMNMALAGFLWALWCQYKQGLGMEFDNYPLIQYRYMKDFYRILKEEGFLDEQYLPLDVSV